MRESCGLAERPAHGRLLATGPDLLDLLNRLSTNLMVPLPAGSGRETVVTSPKGRIVSRLHAFALGADGVVLMTGPEGAGATFEHLQRYTFAEATGLRDVTDEIAQFGLCGPRAGEALRAAGLAQPDRLGVAVDRDVRIFGYEPGCRGGLTVLCPNATSDAMRGRLTEAVRTVGGMPVDDDALELARILDGIPIGGAELTDDVNPLEAGLWDAVRFDKGCYVGQEVVARLKSYDKVARRLVGVEVAATTAPPPGSPLIAEGRDVGRVTSAAVPPGRGGAVALAFVKNRWVEDGCSVCVGSAENGPSGRIVPLPFD